MPSTIWRRSWLTNLLLDRLERSAPARVVTVSSNVPAIGCNDFDVLQGELSYSGGRASSQSKLANVLFTYKLAKRMRGSAVTANALHPGVVRKSFGAEDPARIHRLLVPLLRPVMKSPAQGAATSVHLASALRTRAGVRPLLRQPATHAIIPSKLRPGGRGTALGGERGPGGTHRGTPCLRPPAISRQSNLSVPRKILKPPASTRNQNPLRPTRVLIVDDHAPFRSIARQILTADGFLIVGEAADGAEAIRACGELCPDLVLLDVQLPDIDGFAVAAVLTARVDPPAVVLVSSRSRTDYGSRIEDCRARGFIAKAELSGEAVRRLLPMQNRVPPARS